MAVQLSQGDIVALLEQHLGVLHQQVRIVMMIRQLLREEPFGRRKIAQSSQAAEFLDLLVQALFTERQLQMDGDVRVLRGIPDGIDPLPGEHRLGTRSILITCGNFFARVELSTNRSRRIGAIS